MSYLQRLEPHCHGVGRPRPSVLHPSPCGGPLARDDRAAAVVGVARLERGLLLEMPEKKYFLFWVKKRDRLTHVKMVAKEGAMLAIPVTTNTAATTA